MIPQHVDPAWTAAEACAMATRWKISSELGSRLLVMSKACKEYSGFTFSIISGYRTAEQQEALRAAGRPTAANEDSTHLSCPATGADLQPTIAVTDYVKAQLGVAAGLAGLRWGGGSPEGPGGIPTDWNHVDLGRRA